MTTAQAERNIKLYYWYQIFKEPLFWGAILVTCITKFSGMTLADICLMEAVCVLGIVILDGPFGALADLIGRRHTMFIGMLILTFHILIFGLAINPLMIWIANLLWVFGFALVNGADSSMLADSLKFLGRDNEVQRIEGYSGGYRLALTAVCAIAIGYLAQINLRLPVLMGIPPMVISCWAIYQMIEPPMVANKVRSWSTYCHLLRSSAKFIANRNDVIWIIAFSSLIAIVSKFWFFTYNPYFELVELPLSYYGWIFCLINVISAIFSHQSHRLCAFLGNFGSIALMLILMAVPIYLMGAYVGQMMILMILLSNVVRGSLPPFVSGMLHQHLDSANRATVSSLKTTVTNLGEFFVLLTIGLTLRSWSLPLCLQIVGISTLLFSILLLATFRRSLHVK